MIDAVHKETKDRMVKTIDALKKELQRVRTGRASANMLDSVKVDYYGTLTPLSQMASVSVPESRLITVQPWDATALKEIEKGILKANVGLTPSNDGKIIRISVPPLTEDRRKEIVKMVNKTCEEFKVAVRNIRRDANEVVKGLKKDGEVSEDQQNKALEKIQVMTDDHIKLIDAVYREKEKEVLDI